MADARVGARALLLDTHALLWWVSEPERLPTTARNVIDRALATEGLVVSAASLLEITTLVRRGRIRLNAPLDLWLDDLRALPELRIHPVSADIATRAGGFGDEAPGDPVDRLLMATAVVARLPLVTADAGLRRIEWLETIW